MGLVDKSLDWKAESWLSVLSLEHVIVTRDWFLYLSLTFFIYKTDRNIQRHFGNRRQDFVVLRGSGQGRVQAVSEIHWFMAEYIPKCLSI